MLFAVIGIGAMQPFSGAIGIEKWAYGQHAHVADDYPVHLRSIRLMEAQAVQRMRIVGAIGP